MNDKKHCACGKTLGLCRGEGGAMLLDGRPFYGVGVNYYSLFLSALERDWDIEPSLRAMQTLKDYDCRVIRFSTLPFYVEEFGFYEQTERYWSTMDRVVRRAEDLKIGLLPSLFWTYAVNDYCDEPYQSAYLDPNSKTVAFVREYTEKFVTRYRESPAVYGWEFSNERVLGSDFPDASHFRKLWDKSSRTCRDERDRVTLDGLEAMYRLFAEAVSAADPYGRIISTGDTNPRETSYNQYAYGRFEADTHAEHEWVLDKINPPGITALSQHQYSYGELLDPGNVTYPLLDYFNTWESFFTYLMQMAAKRGMATYAGEVGYSHAHVENYPRITVECAVRPFQEAVRAQRTTRIPLILFWNYDPEAVSLNPAFVYDRGTGVEYSFSERSERGRRILETMREGNRALDEMGRAYGDGDCRLEAAL